MKEKTARGPDGTIFVRPQYSGISMLVLLSDGIPMTFEKTRNGRVITWLKLDDVIAWHEKEITVCNGKELENRKKVLAGLIDEWLKAKQKTKTGGPR